MEDEELFEGIADGEEEDPEIDEAGIDDDFGAAKKAAKKKAAPLKTGVRATGGKGIRLSQFCVRMLPIPSTACAAGASNFQVAPTENCLPLTFCIAGHVAGTGVAAPGLQLVSIMQGSGNLLAGNGPIAFEQLTGLTTTRAPLAARRVLKENDPLTFNINNVTAGAISASGYITVLMRRV